MGPSLTCSSCGHEDVVKEYKSPLPSHLLETNDPPLASEEQFLREMLEKSNFEREIADLDAKLADFDKMAVALRRRREKTVESFIAAKGVLSPIRRVPAEIVGEIILLALTDSITGSIKGTSVNVNTGPWVYSQVCRLWRKEILSRTFIWSNIGILHHREQANNSHSAEILDEIFQRSQLRPLRLCLQLLVDSDAARDILATAVKNSNHWKDVRLHLTNKLSKGLKQIKDRIPLLEALHLQYSSSTQGPIASKDLIHCFRKAPALRKLALQRFSDVHSLNIPWSKLTHFHDSSGQTSISELLPKIPNIVSLAISRRYPESSTSNLQFHLNNLRTLNLADCRQIPTCLRVPALEELKVGVGCLHNISAFIRRSSCHLTHLSIVFPMLSIDNDDLCDINIIRTLFHNVPQLATLEFECSTMSERHEKDMMKIIGLLTDTTLLPALRRLVVAKSSLEVSLKPLVKVVRSRQKASSTLTEILFTAPYEKQYTRKPADEIVAANLEHIQVIRTIGMKVLVNAAASTTFEVVERKTLDSQEFD
ncbi:hypothetical protein C8J56DRAFT_1160046 [Mycena floridula]|nr:hypothetical protein C8J56DRAFT_1160046 [Mycena floridula]